MKKPILILMTAITVWMIHPSAVAQDAAVRDLGQLAQELDMLKSNYPELAGSSITRRKKQIIATAEFVRAACSSFNAIDAQLDQSTMLQAISDLNNPSNDDLGFSLESVLESLIENHITKDMNQKSSSGILNTVRGILDNPITQVVGGSVPAIGGVMGFLSNVGFTSKKVTNDNINELFSEFKDYLEYYEELHEGNMQFKSNLSDIRTRKRALFKILENYAYERSQTVYGADDDSTMYKGFLTDMINRHYNMDKVSNYLNTMDPESQKLNNPQLSFSPYLISQARYIADELEALYNQHLETHIQYFEKIEEALQRSKTLDGANTEKINAKIAMLEDIQHDWETTFRLLIDLETVESKFNKLLGVALN